MDTIRPVIFTWGEDKFQGEIEKEYENSYLVVVSNPSDELIEKYMGRLVISKSVCQETTAEI